MDSDNNTFTDSPPAEPQDDTKSPGSQLFRSTTHECLFVVLAAFANAQTSVFQGATVIITAKIGDDLNMTSAEIAWITASAALTGGAFLLAFGKIADIFGRRQLFILSMAGYSVSLLIAGFANSAIYLDIFSGIIGLASAAAVPPAVGCLGAVYPRPSKRKNYAFSCFCAGGALGFVVGMLVSGIASYVSSWRASFWTLAVIYSIFTGITAWTVPSDGPRSPGMSTLKQFDILGTLLIVAGFGSFSSALTLSGEAPDGWKTDYVITLLIVGVALLAGFIFWQSIATHPLMPLYIWKERNFSLLMIIFSLCYMGFAATLFYLPLYLQKVKNYSALLITAQMLPLVCSGVITNIICAAILHLVSQKLLMGLAGVLYIAAFLILGFMSAETTYWAFVFPALIILTVGVDLQYNVANIYVMSSLPPSHQSIAGGVFSTATKLSSNIAMGIATSVYTSMIKRAAPENADEDVIRPYLGVYWFAAATAGVSLCFLPFLTVRNQSEATVQKVTSNDDEIRMKEGGKGGCKVAANSV